MSEFITVARPYAKAAFDYAVETQAIEQWQSMLLFAAEVARNEDVSNLLSGGLSSEESANLLITLCGEQLDESGKNFIRIVAENRRLAALPEVLNQFVIFKTEHEGIVDVEVVAFNELSETQKSAISEAMQKRLSRKVRLHCTIDSSIMGGIVIRAGDLVIDSSIRGRLNRLTDVLQS